MPVAIYIQQGHKPYLWFEELLEDGRHRGPICGNEALEIQSKYTHRANIVSSTLNPHISVLQRTNIANRAQTSSQKFQLSEIDRFRALREELSEDAIVVVR